ncbi:MAG: hypothetical protein RID05_09215 [Cytophagales bacterium]
MKIVYITLLYFSITLSCFGQTKMDFYDKNGSVLMDKITVRQFIEELKITKEKIDTESEIKNDLGGILVHRLHTNGQQDTNWISHDDLDFLSTLIDSDKPAKCVIRDISSNLLHTQKTTLGNQVILILYSCMQKLNYPYKFNICGETAQLYKKDVVKWLRKRK